jgi:putative ABC transport system permease protein
LNVLRALGRGALRTFPSEFRRLFGEEMLRYLEAEPERLPGNLLDVLKGGLIVRAEDVGRDLAYAAARLRRAPVFVAIVILTFAIGIGANVAVFSAFNAIVLRPLPFAHPERLVTISKRVGTRTGPGAPLAPLDLSDLRAQLHGVTSISGILESQATTLIHGTPQTLRGARVGATFFSTIGAVPEIGRLFEVADGRGGRQNVVISDRLWRTYFSADPAAVGKRISLDGTSYAIVGVAQPDARAPEPYGGWGGTLLQPDYFTAMPDTSVSYARGSGGIIGTIASLAPGTTITQLDAELLVASERVQALYPRTPFNKARVTFVARPLADQLIGSIAGGLWMVLFAVFGILLVACANVANLIATRWSAREREVAIRRALGASGGRIAAQLFIETGVLAACGGVAGVAFAYLGLRVMPLTALDAVPRAHAIAIDGPTLLYALAMVCLTTIFAGLAPVLSLGRGELQLVLNSAGRGGDASRGHGLRSALVVAEVAIALALVISSGLFIRSFVTLLNVPLGIRADGVYVSESFTVSDRDDPKLWAAVLAQQRRLLARIEAVPGVDAAALALTFPSLPAFGVGSWQVRGKTCSAFQGPYATANHVSAGYFRALGIPLLRGSAFASGRSTTGPVVVVSQAFADKFVRGGDAIGQSVRVCGSTGPWMTVIGVVSNVSQQLGTPPLPEVYVPNTTHPAPLFSVVVHAPHSSLAATQTEIQSAFATVYPQMPPPGVHTVSNVVELLTRRQRSAAALLGGLAVLSLLLALSGIFGVVSFQVAQRSREFGIRIALGARAPRILRDVLRRSLTTTAAGVAIGTVLAAADARAIAPYLTVRPDLPTPAIASQLLVSPLDPLTFGIVIGLIFVCSTVAALIPAVRATNVDPAVALRYE